MRPFDKKDQQCNAMDVCGVRSAFYEKTLTQYASCDALGLGMTQLLLLGKLEYTGGPIFKVVLEC